MIPELRTRLGVELDRLSKDLERRAVLDATADSLTADVAGREQQRTLERRVRLLGQLVGGLECVDPRAISFDRAGYGSVVRVRDLASGREEVYTLMAGDFIDLDGGQVSLASPIGHALVDRAVGERVAVATPRGERHYELVGLVTLPAALGLDAGGADGAALQVA